MVNSNASKYTFAYYCSGHGFGHATRVVALTHELLTRSHSVYICTNAPEHVFRTAIDSGASYRHAEIDAGIVQPKAYDVARRKTIDGLKRFLGKREEKLDKEVHWLKEIKADAVLVDAPFLPCAAAARAGIPSVIISNFTFDSCYSYLSVSTRQDTATSPLSLAMAGAQIDETTNKLQVPNGNGNGTHFAPSSSSTAAEDEENEPPVPADQIEPLVRQVTEDYANASLLLRLPGCIPIPAFDTDVPMPAEKWTNLAAHSFKDDIMDLLARDVKSIPSCSSTGTSGSSSSQDDQPKGGRNIKRTKRVIETPLIARPVAKTIYTKEKRRKILDSLGIPEHQHDSETTKILVVSFGGQSIPKPTASRPPTPNPPSPQNGLAITIDSANGSGSATPSNSRKQSLTDDSRYWPNMYARRDSEGHPGAGAGSSLGFATPLSMSTTQDTAIPPADTTQRRPSAVDLSRVRNEARPHLQRTMTQDHIYLPGAPPALHKPGTITHLNVSSSSSAASTAASLGLSLSMSKSRSGGGPKGGHRRKISIEIPKVFRSETDEKETFDEEIQVPMLMTTSTSSHGSMRNGHTTSNGQRTSDEYPSSHQEEQELEVPEAEEEEAQEQLIPKGWIAIVCGLSAKDGTDELPENFYAAPRDVYVPDLTAISDVLLGKLGYGTCSETVSSQTPFVYVPRPLFVEEFGLKRLMETRGTALPMTRADFEAGNWAKLITQAYELGKEKRRKHVDEFKRRVDEQNGRDGERAEEGEEESAAAVIAREVEKFMFEGMDV